VSPDFFSLNRAAFQAIYTSSAGRRRTKKGKKGKKKRGRDAGKTRRKKGGAFL